MKINGDILEKVDDREIENGKFIIPKGIKYIGSQAFGGCTNLEEIEIPEDVIQIGSGAFWNCSKLSKINIPEGVDTIKMDTFNGCTSLSEISLPKRITSIDPRAFQDCSSLSHITIPESVTMISNSVFSGCSNLSEITLPESVTVIESQAFSDCSSLSKITIPEKVTHIGWGAFKGCSSLAELTIPEGVINIDNATFKGCTGLSKIKMNDKIESIGYEAFQDCNSLSEINIPENVTWMGSYAFTGCSSLTEIKIPEKLTNISMEAFRDCPSLKEITIPEGVKKIDHRAFQNCSNLSKVVIPESVYEIGGRAFGGCSSLSEITLPEGLERIEDHMFNGCSSLTEVRIPEKIAYIGSKAFNNCGSLTKIAIPEGVTEIYAGAFANCSSLSEINIPKGVTRIDDELFYGCENLSNITIPENVERIGVGAFQGCSSLLKITIPEQVDVIKQSTFAGCSSLTKINIPESVKRIHESAFASCSSLSEINIPEGILKIDNEVFSGCKSLSNIILPKSVRDIESRAFSGCSSLTEINIPENVTHIGSGTFYGCSSLLKIRLPKNLEKINSELFNGCSSLSNIIIPEKTEEICDKAFRGCSNLSNIILPEGLTTIKNYAFDGCSSLTEIAIPGQIENIHGNAFNNCPNLERINIKSIKRPNINKDNIEVMDDSKYLLEGVDYKYLSIDGVLYISTMDESIKGLVRYPEGKKEASSYVLADGTIEVQSPAFKGCTSLKKIIIPKDIMQYEAGVGFDYNNIEYDKDKEVIILKNEEPNKSSKYIPEAYLSQLFESNEIENFISNSDFRAFNSNIQNLKEMLKEVSEEEKLDFFKFATCLGCFSTEKFLDKNSKETEFTIGQKASALLAKLIKTPQLKLGEYHGLFDSLSFNAKSSQELIKFLTPQGKKNDNLELLTGLEHDCPGIFAKVMAGFDEAKEYRNTLAEDGTTKVLPWEEALKNFYSANKYIGITENTKDIAEVYSSKGLKQDVFDKGVRLREKAEKMNVPENILGTSIRELSILEKIEQLKQQTAEELSNSKEIIDELYDKQFTYEWLNKNDPKNGIMGLYVSCCGTITSSYYGRYIAESSIIQKDVQNLVVRDAKGEIISKGTMYINEEHGYGLFNDFELNQKYREHENRSNGYGGKYAGDEKDESELSESEKNQRKERDLIFSAFQRGISAFVEEYDKQHPDKPLQQINVGMGYNRLKRNVEQFEEATKLLTAPAEYSFEDANKGQYILYKRDEKEKTDVGVQEREER